MHTQGIQCASAEEYRQSGVRARMLALGRTAGLSHSSDPCLLTLTCSALFSLNDIKSLSDIKSLVSMRLEKTRKKGEQEGRGKTEKGQCDVGSPSGTSKVGRLPEAAC